MKNYIQTTKTKNGNPKSERVTRRVERSLNKRLLSLTLTIMLLLILQGGAWGQTTIYSQDFGTGNSMPSGWSASGSSTWTISTSSSSSGYTGASGGSNLASGSNNSSRTVTVQGVISTAGYYNISILWGARKINTSKTLTCQWSIDGINWNNLSFTDVSNNSTWALVNGGTGISLPAGASGANNLRIYWSFDSDGSGGAYRIDDFIVKGTACETTITCPSPITANASSGTCGATVNYTLPTWTDDCSAAAPSGFGAPVYNPANGHYYALSNTAATWVNAEAACEAVGGHLVTITDAAENAFVLGKNGGQSVWIGFTDQVVEGTFVWVTGESATYTNWNSGEPNNSSGTYESCDSYARSEDYTELTTSGTWNDASCGQTRYYIIELGVSLIQTAGLSSGSTFPVGTITNTFVATNTSGNTATCNFTVTVNDNPTIANISAPAAACEGSTWSLTTPAVTPKGSSIATQGWQIESAQNSGSFSNAPVPFNVLYADNGKKIRYYASTSCGTTVYGNEVALAVNALPTFTVNKTDITCFNAGNGTITISAGSGSGTGYEYSINAGSSWQTGGNYTGLGPATYTIKVKDSNGCMQTICQ